MEDVLFVSDLLVTITKVHIINVNCGFNNIIVPCLYTCALFGIVLVKDILYTMKLL